MLRKIQPCAERLGGIAGQRGKTEEDVDEYQKLADEELIQKLREGDERIMDYILEKYKPLVLRKANAMFLIGGDTDDLIQEGMIGLFKAVRDYDSEQGTSFASFADLCISRQMYSAIKASQRQKHMPLNSYISLYEQGEDTQEEKQQPLIETIQTMKDNNPEELFLNKEYLQMIEQELKQRLSDLENRVLHLHLLGIDYQTIAKLLDKSPKSIDNALQRIKAKMAGIVQI